MKIWEDQRYDMIKQITKDFTKEMQDQILNDIGSGSIFENIIKINQKLSKRLKRRVNLQDELLRKEQGEDGDSDLEFNGEEVAPERRMG